MKKPVIVLTDPLLPKTVEKKLAGRATLLLATTPRTLARALPLADGLVTLLSMRVDDSILKYAPNLKAVGNYAVGIDNIDLKACKRRGIRVLNTPDVLTRSSAELAFALLLAVARRIPEGEALCREGRFKGWKPSLLLGLELKGRKAVIVGQGRIGQETARLFKALGIRVEFITRRTDRPERILKSAQILSLHCPLTKDTHHWLNQRRLSLLPRDAMVINTSRGAVIDEAALIHVLKEGQIFGAGLDVFEHEPKIPEDLRRLPNVVLLPHVASATTRARSDMVELLLSGLLAVLNGKRPSNLVKL